MELKELIDAYVEIQTRLVAASDTERMAVFHAWLAEELKSVAKLKEQLRNEQARNRQQAP